MSDWRDEGLCLQVGPDRFFPKVGFKAAPAKAICAQCPVRQPCLDFALSLPQVEDRGIFGGTTERERWVLRRAEKVA